MSARLLQRSARAFVMLAMLMMGLSADGVSAREEIVDFHSEITVLPNGEIEVIEQLRVNVEHRQIKRGIFRDFPTRYPHHEWGAFHLFENVDFELLGVERNGRREAVRVAPLTNGMRMVIGNPNRYVQRGEHVYRIKYRTARQLSQGERKGGSYDVLNWNVTGQGWEFPIRRATARVTFPEDIDPDTVEGWTGKAGSQASDFRYEMQSSRQVFAETTRSLGRYEGFSLRVASPQGAIQSNAANGFIKDNWRWLIAVLGLVSLPVYYLSAWVRVGRDPEKGVVVADYHPVREMSPAAHRFVVRNRYDDKTFASAVLNMAVKGWITISQKGKSSFTLSQVAAGLRQPLAEGERRVYDALFRGRSEIALGKKYQPDVATAKQRHRSYLNNELRGAIYKDNRRYSMLGAVLGFAVLMMFAWHLSNGAEDVMAQYFFVSAVLTMVLFMVTVFAGKHLLMLMPFLAIMAMSGFFSGEASVNGMAGLLLLAAIVSVLYLLFYWLLRAPTPFGRKVLDEVEGFRLYLGTAEQKRMEILHPPERTPELFERLLPYAMALDVETQWTEQFADVMAQGADPGKMGQRRYSPGWYRGGRYSDFGARGFTQALSAGLSSSVAAAATAPAARGGVSTGGGGFGGGGAGGGGGGGGGGGW